MDPFLKYPELKTLPPGLELLRAIIERLFVDNMPAQYAGLQGVLREVPADLVIGDDYFLGLLPMLLTRLEAVPNRFFRHVDPALAP
jgi:hypothetical protein